MRLVSFLFALIPTLAMAGAAAAQDVFVLGEVHDNPAHHAEQARRVAQIAPRALVFEMLTEAQAARIPDGPLPDAATLADLLDWEKSGWPDFQMYYPIFAAAPGARIYGAGLDREAARAAMQGGIDPEIAMRFGLDAPLPPAEQAAREALQREAHCNALPEEMLADMVRVQRLRDAMLARATLEAFDATGGPVVVITGNGHARKDWGMPAILARIAPELKVHVLGQTEDGKPLDGIFDEVVSAPSPARDDPCAVFDQAAAAAAGPVPAAGL